MKTRLIVGLGSLFALASSANAGIFLGMASQGGGVQLRDPSGNPLGPVVAPFGGFSGGVRVAAGDVNGDGVADFINGAGPGAAGGHVKVFDGANGATLHDFFAFAPNFVGGVQVAFGRNNFDLHSRVITGAGPGGGPHVKVFDPASGTVLHNFFAYAPNFTGGVSVASGDINGDGFADVITGAGAGATGGHVKVFDGSNGAELASFFAFEGFSGGVRVATGDVTGDGRDDIIVGAGAGGNGHVKVFDGGSGAQLASFFAYGANFNGGVSISAGDIDGDGITEILTGSLPPEGGAALPQVKVFRGDGFQGASFSEVASFFAFNPSFSGGVEVAAYVVPAPGAVGLGAVGMIAGLRRRR